MWPSAFNSELSSMSILQKLLGLVPEAPKDGKAYVRRNGSWEEVPIASIEEVNESLDKALK